MKTETTKDKTLFSPKAGILIQARRRPQFFSAGGKIITTLIKLKGSALATSCGIIAGSELSKTPGSYTPHGNS